MKHSLLKLGLILTPLFFMGCGALFEFPSSSEVQFSTDSLSVEEGEEETLIINLTEVDTNSQINTSSSAGSVNALDKTTVYNWEIVDGENEFEQHSGSVTFTESKAQIVLKLKPIIDGYFEGDRTYQLVLKNSKGVAQGDGVTVEVKDKTKFAHITELVPSFNFLNGIQSIDLKPGESSAIRIDFDSPATETAVLRVSFYGGLVTSANQIVPDVEENLIIEKGDTSVTIPVTHPLSLGLAGVHHLSVVIEDAISQSTVVNVTLYSLSAPRDFDLIESGDSVSCGIKSGDLYCWGSGAGPVGVVTSTSVNNPNLVDSGGWTDVSIDIATFAHACGIKSGNLYCWGYDFDGELGNGVGRSDSDTPDLISATGTWEQVSTGDDHSCGIDNGDLYCWGGDDDGEVGNGGGSVDINSPQLISGSGTWSDISAKGAGVSCGVDNGDLYCWGKDNLGQVGNGSGASVDVTSPELVSGTGTWSKVAVGKTHVCGIDLGDLFCWGSDSNGQQANGDVLVANVETPNLVSDSGQWTWISSGDGTSCGVQSGNLYCWGADSSQQVGNGPERTNVESLELISEGGLWTNVSVGRSHTCGLRDSKRHCWGGGPFLGTSATGNGDAVVSNYDEPQILMSAQNWTVLTKGFDTSCGVKNGDLYCWGINNNGGVGNSTYNRVGAPLLISSTGTWTHVDAGFYHTCGIDDGDLYCWGGDGSGGVGNGTDYSNAPTLISDSGTWTQISAGFRNSCGVNADSLYCWGSGFSGQIGNGSTGLERSLQLIDSTGVWTHSQPSSTSSCGIKDGNLYCWGGDSAGQVGNGAVSTTNVLSPELIDAGGDWQTLDNAQSSVCGIKGGDLYCWGSDSDGQLGNGSGATANMDTPQLISASGTWTKIKAGQNNFCGIDDAKLYCWGSDSGGKTGNGSVLTADVESPQLIATDADAVDVSLDWNGVLVTLENGFIYQFGSNFSAVTFQHTSP